MNGTITVINNKNGAESPMTREQFNNIKDTPEWRGVFRVKEEPEVEEPAEVKELKNTKQKRADASPQTEAK